MRRMSLDIFSRRTSVVGGAFALAVVLAACSGGDTTTSPSGGILADTITVSGEIVDSIGAAFDAHVAAGDDLFVPISQILGGLIPSLSANPAGTVDSIISNGVPATMDQQFSDLAEAFRENVRYSVDNFVSTAALSGATVRATGAPLDRS